jgi:hypothetical protein
MLSDDEKRFVALFVENYRYFIKPRYKNFISFFSYLDGTNESEKHQQIQLSRDDPYFVDMFQLIAHSKRKDPVNWVRKEFQKHGFFENPTFQKNFEIIASWLSSEDYATYCEELYCWAQKIKRSLSESEMNADNFSNWGRDGLEPDKDFKVGWWREQL